MTDVGEFEVILFDVGGVMLTNGWDHRERAAVLEQFGLDREEFEARHPDANDAWERDAIDINGYLNATVFYEPRGFTTADFIEAMKAQSVPIPGNAMDILKELALTSPCLIGVLNNESRILHEYRMEKYDLNSYLDVQLASCYLGMRKPDAEIYRRAIDIVGRPAESILFIDDREGNTEAAIESGMQAIQFTDDVQLRNHLRQLEIL